ncbi:MAG: hypothetical protein HQ581_01145, partial [Planctomycetes bacterium]|nr:hypothetical protein [Planctomycetota bacterium]
LRPGLLVLKNGAVLQGGIRQIDRHFEVVTPLGQMRIRVEDVDFRCGSLDEAYFHKRQEVPPGEVRQHLNLAEWCLAQGLLGRATFELAAATATDPTFPRIALVRRRLDAAVARRDNPWQAPETLSPSSPPVRLSDLGPSIKELDRLTEGMPPGTMQVFAGAVQPLLVNRCSMADCHGPAAASEFRLARLPSGQSIRRITQRNLYAVVRQIDQKNPGASPLLTEPIRPHGSAKLAPLSTRQITQYKQLTAWVRQVARGDLGIADAAPLEPPPPLTARTVPNVRFPEDNAPGNPAANGVRQASHEEPAPPASPFGFLAPDDATEVPPTLREQPSALPSEQPMTLPSEQPMTLPSEQPMTLPSEQPMTLPSEQPMTPAGRLKRGNPMPGYTPVDPFDPELFNRRYFPDRTPRGE